MSKINKTYERISRYLKGILSGRERHDLERDMMQDVFDEEAFEGLNLMNAEELESDMTALENRLDQRIHQPKKNSRLLILSDSRRDHFHCRTGNGIVPVPEAPFTRNDNPAGPSGRKVRTAGNQNPVGTRFA